MQYQKTSKLNYNVNWKVTKSADQLEFFDAISIFSISTLQKQKKIVV